MRSSKFVAPLLCGLLLVLQGCCCMRGQCGAGGGAEQQDQAGDAATGLRHQRVCTQHQMEPPFDLTVKPPGPGIVFGTGDFDGGGAVLIKLQVQDYANIEGNEGTITAWSGNGAPPLDIASVPSDASAFYKTNLDVTLPYWTSHLLRDYAPSVNAYWVVVKVDHKEPDGDRVVRYLHQEWTPNATASPDTPHNFGQYTN